MNISTKILRHYDHLDLLKPCYISPDTKYRYYSYDQFFIIDVIRYLNKTLSIPLEDIKNLLEENKDCDKLITFLESHKIHLDRKIEALEYSKQVTDSLISDIKLRKKHPKKVKIYEQFLMSRYLYYKELNVSIYDIDKYVNRNFKGIKNLNNSENNTMCLLFSLSEYEKTGELIVKGFGIFSDHKIPELKYINLREGCYIHKCFLYSEENAKDSLNDLVRYAKVKDMKLDDTAFLVSKMVDLSVYSKYDYYMDLQIMYHL